VGSLLVAPAFVISFLSLSNPSPLSLLFSSILLIFLPSSFLSSPPFPSSSPILVYAMSRSLDRRSLLHEVTVEVEPERGDTVW
jgi:hypothetical protein